MATHDDILLLLEQRTDIDGRFTSFQRIGNGGGNFSALVSANDRSSGKKVAVKVSLPHQDRYRADCFEREALLLEQLLGEPDIVQLVASKSVFTEVLVTQSGLQIPWQFHYYAIELAKGDFSDVIASGGWSAERTLLAFRSLCRAVQRIHARQIAHRDLKPSNMLVMPNNDIKLSDFGTARRIDSTTPALVGAYIAPPGDRRYCAPEMLGCLHDEDPAIAFRSDFFSLGAILYEMFSGTILGLQLFNPQFWADIAQAMLAVKVGRRRATYDQIVGNIANSRLLPSVATFGAATPPSIRDRVDDLYRSLASIDYRTRLCDFERIFNKINICLLVVRNESAYERWLEEKRRRRGAALSRILGAKP